MDGSKIPTATFLVNENGLLQQTSGAESILSETIISSGATDTITTQDNCIAKTSSCQQPTVMFSEAETVIGGCSGSSPSITIETMTNSQFLTAQTTVTNHENALENVLALSSSSSCSTALSNAPTFTFKTASIFDQNTSSLPEIKDASTNFIDAIECSPLDTAANPSVPIANSIENNSDVRKFFTLPNTIKKINNKFTVSGKKMGFKIIKKETLDTISDGRSETTFSNTTPNRITIKNKPMSTIPLTGVTLGNGLDNAASQTISDICLAIDGELGTVVSGEEDEAAAAPQAPPPGSVSKLARNATLIDLNKIRKNQGHNKPLLIDEVTVMIDESDTVKVVDYGSNAPSIENYKSDFYSPIKRHSNSSNHRKKGRRRKSSWMTREGSPSAEEGGALAGDRGNYPEDDLFCVEETLEPDTDNGEPSHNQFDDSNLSVALENMRRLRVDCNVALVDPRRECIVYAHRAVLVARSPYFYKTLYLRRKRLNFLHQFCRFTLNHRINFQAVEAVVSFMYSGALSTLFGVDCDSRDVLKVLQLFEMADAADLFASQMPTEAPKLRSIKHEPSEEDHFMPHSIFNSPPAEEVTIDERKKRRKLTMSGGMSDHDRNSSMDGINNSVTSVPGFIVNSAGEEIRMKSSVQKLVDSALTPFLCKLEELFDPNSSTMQVAKTSQHVITLWNADLLLTKLFDQNELTKYFTDYMNEVMEVGTYSSEHHTSNVGSYVVETLTNTANFDEEYIRVGCTDSVVPEVETLMVGEMQIINYTQMEPRHIPKYVRLISLYKFRIVIGDESNKHGGLLAPMLEEDDSSHFRTIVEGLSLREGLNGLDPKNEETTRLCFKQVSQDLSRRTIADLDVRLNVNYQEEMIMHIIVEQMEVDGVLPLVIGIFLAKGCSFCRKRECKAEDLSTPIGPDNPVCPDRQCIRKNLLCQICNKQMSSSKSLARHKYSVHDAVQGGEAGGMFICSHCGETFGKKWKLNVHEKQHEDRKLQVTCHLCNKVMRGAIALKKHINMVHETKRQFSCVHCHKMFKRRETLLVHQRIHTGEKPFVCSHCDYSSETKGNLKAHTWRKHKRSLLATSVGTNGVETSITGPLSTVEGMMEDGRASPGNTNNAATSSNGDGGGEDEGDVLDGPVLELEGPVEGTGSDEHNMAASLVAHAHLQETTFMMT